MVWDPDDRSWFGSLAVSAQKTKGKRQKAQRVSSSVRTQSLPANREAPLAPPNFREHASIVGRRFVGRRFPTFLWSDHTSAFPYLSRFFWAQKKFRLYDFKPRQTPGRGLPPTQPPQRSLGPASAPAARLSPKTPPAAPPPVGNACGTWRDPVAPWRAQSHDSHWQELWWISPAVHVCWLQAGLHDAVCMDL